MPNQTTYRKVYTVRRWQTLTTIGTFTIVIGTAMLITLMVSAIAAAIVKQPSTLHDIDNAVQQKEARAQSPIQLPNVPADQYSINTRRSDKAHMDRIINADVIRHGGYLVEANKPRYRTYAVPERYPERIAQLIQLKPSQIKAKDSKEPQYTEITRQLVNDSTPTMGPPTRVIKIGFGNLVYGRTRLAIIHTVALSSSAIMYAAAIVTVIMTWPYATPTPSTPSKSTKPTQTRPE